MLEAPDLPVYAFDIDGVLCDTHEVLKASLEKQLQVTLESSGRYESFGYHHADPLVMAFLNQYALAHWQDPAVYRNGVSTGQYVVHGLARRGRFAGYVTRRDAKLGRGTTGWLIDKGFPALTAVNFATGAPDAVLAHPLRHAAPQRNKADYVKAIGATCLVEDSPHEAEAVARGGVDVVVIRKGYNRDFEQEVGALALWEEWARRVSFISALEELL